MEREFSEGPLSLLLFREGLNLASHEADFTYCYYALHQG